MPIEAALRLARALRGGDEEPRKTTPQITALRDPEALARAMEFRESVMYPEYGKRPIDEQASWYSAAGYRPEDIRGGMKGITSSPTAQAKATEMALGMGPGATVFHGSPHKFEKFDAAKIGTGEGAQAYGHGLYFAENPAVAKNYALAGVPQNQGEATVILQSGQRLQGPSLTDQMLDDVAKGRVKGARLVYEKIRPNLYHVDLPDEQIARMIDWDKPLAQQSHEVQQAVKKLWQESRVYGDPENLTGEGIHGSLTAHHLGVGMERGAGKEAAAQDLRYYGIPGIRYLDQGSRAGGEGTSNYVVFNPEILKILRRE